MKHTTRQSEAGRRRRGLVPLPAVPLPAVPLPLAALLVLLPLLPLLPLLAAPLGVPQARADAAPSAPFGLEHLARGMRVEVRLSVRGERLKARRITLKSDAGHQLEVKAPVDMLLAPGTPAFAEAGGEARFVLLGRPVHPTADVAVRGAADAGALLGALRPGTWLKLRCRDRDALLVADHIDLRRQSGGRPEIEGPINHLRQRGHDRARLEIGGFSIEVNQRTEFAVDSEEVAWPPAGGALRALPAAPAIDDDDARPRGVRLLDGRVSVGGQMSWLMVPQTEYDLDTSLDGNRTTGRLSAQLEAEARLAPGLDGFLKLTTFRVVGIEEPPGVDLDQGDARLLEAYATWKWHQPWVPGRLSLQVGRQDFDEPREWLYDEYLDGARLAWQGGGRRRARIELAVAARVGASDPAVRERTYRILMASSRVARGVTAAAYLIDLNDPTARDDDARWLGLRSQGTPLEGVSHWLELGWQRGRAAGGSSRHRGYAVDAGAILEPLAWRAAGGGAARWRPSLTLGFALGSGDSNGADSELRTYRQTGLEDNNDVFSGVTSFRYYGEVLAPELTNLRVLTGGVGLRPLGSTSIDVVYHRYRQDRASTRVRGADIGGVPDGRDPHLGSAVDLIVGYEEIRNLEIELDVGRFMPGAAFGGGAAAAQRASLQARYNF